MEPCGTYFRVNVDRNGQRDGKPKLLLAQRGRYARFARCIQGGRKKLGNNGCCKLRDPKSSLSKQNTNF